MRRFLLQVIGGTLAVLALCAHVQGQGSPDVVGAPLANPAPAAIQRPKVRVLAIARTPLADEHLPDGGVILAVAIASLSHAGSEVDVRWTKAALTPTLLSDPSIDISLPLTGADCERPNDLGQVSAMLCDHATYSDPILQVVIGLFTLSNSPFKFDADESIFGKTICIPQDYDASALNANGRDWFSQKQVAVLRQPTLLDCVAAVQVREADAFLASDLEGRFLLNRLGLTRFFRMAERSLETRGVHAVVSREHAQGSELIDALNRGLKQLKQSNTYSDIIQRHVMRLWDPQASALPATDPAMAAPVTGSGADARQPISPSQPTGRPAPPITAPVMLPADRERALRFLKRGNEELADSRVAPARLLYERAAEMGLAEAAMALAATYDTGELVRLNLRGIRPDAKEAKRWYERARTLGASDADQRLQRLGAN